MSLFAVDPEIVALDRAEIAVESWSWKFAFDRRDEIDRHFVARQRDRGSMWNGRVLLLHRYAIVDRVLRGACFETDFASFLAWRDWDFADRNVANVFAAAALQGADGGYLVGEMASNTANAGLLYFPCGTPDPSDVDAGGMLDLAGSVGRELLEETGVAISTLGSEPGWCLLRDRGFLALIKRVTARESAEELRNRILRNIAKQSQPEFADVHVVRGRMDLNARMPRFVVTYFEHAWRNAGAI
jgi:hypothetical protein